MIWRFVNIIKQILLTNIITSGVVSLKHHVQNFSDYWNYNLINWGTLSMTDNYGYIVIDFLYFRVYFVMTAIWWRGRADVWIWRQTLSPFGQFYEILSACNFQNSRFRIFFYFPFLKLSLLSKKGNKKIQCVYVPGFPPKSYK